MLRLTRQVCLIAALALANEATLQLDQWLSAYEQTWTTIRDKHFDKELNGLDWGAVGEQTRRKIQAAKSEVEARQALEAMLGRLGHSHVGIIPKESFAAIESGKGEGTFGLEMRMVDGKPVVWRVQPGSPAAKAGIRPGWILETSQPIKGGIFRQLTIANALVSAEVGKAKTLRFHPGGEFTLEAVRAPGRLAVFGNLPPLPVEMEFQKKQQAGYFRLSAFFEPDWLQTEMAQAVSQCGDCKGFVIDLRGNPGGLGALSAALLGWFLDKEATLGTLYLRDFSMKLVANPRPEAFRGKLAVLVDPLSASTSEFFAGAVKDLGRGKIFGEATAGMALPSYIEKLPTGDALQYTTANYLSAAGGPLEGKGVTPDVAAPLTQADLLAGRDAAWEAALQWIRE